MRKFLILLLILTAEIGLALESEMIKSCGEYYFGEVVNSESYQDLSEARDKALQRLSENISVMVKSDFKSAKVEVNGEYSKSVKNIMQTYSGITLRNLTPIENRDRKGWNVLYYIHRDSLENIYNERKKVIFEIYEKARSNEEDLYLARALQWYYYSMILMNSIPLKRIEYKGCDLRVEIADRIEKILDGVQFIYERENFEQNNIRDVYFRLEYADKPVKLLEFSYIEKGKEIIETARDGRVRCRLTGASITYQELEIYIQYQYAQNRKQMVEITQLWDAIIKPDFENRKMIDLNETDSSRIQVKKYQIVKTPQYEKSDIKLVYDTLDVCPVKEEIAESVTEFLISLQEKNFSSVYLQDEFLSNKLLEMDKFNQVEIIDKKYHYEINKTYEGWEVRSIPVYCKYETLNKRSMDYLVLDFDNTGKLQDVNFSVFKGLYEGHVGKFKDNQQDKNAFWRRQVLVKFLEKYRSAYLNRDLETLNQIFDDEAVIIVGRILKRGETDNNYEYGKTKLQPDIEYLQMDKNTFLKRQKEIFTNQEDISLGFSNCDFNQKNSDEDVYGISMRQQYTSTGYSDEGYLFLLIDFKENDPMIYVRSWQPSKWTEDELIKLSNYRKTN